ncbi:MAG: LamG domain-containing protein [Patescibacteria group bacterium]
MRDAFCRSPGASSSLVKANEGDRLVRCRVCGFICDRERDVRIKDGRFAGLGVQYGAQLTAGTSKGDSYHTPFSLDHYVKFDGKSTALRVEASSAVNIYSSTTPNSPFTFEAKVYPLRGGEGNSGNICYKDQSASSTNPSAGYKFHLFGPSSVAAKLGANARHGDGTDAQRATSATSSLVLNFAQWSLVHFVYNSGGDKKISIYVNGSAAALSTQSAGVDDLLDDASLPLFVGNRWKGDQTFNGYIRDVRIYKGVGLTSAQITAVYASSEIAGSTAFWDFDEGAGIYLKDKVGGLIMSHYLIASSTSSTLVAANWDSVVSESKTPDKYYNRTVAGGCPACGTYLYDEIPRPIPPLQ